MSTRDHSWPGGQLAPIDMDQSRGRHHRVVIMETDTNVDVDSEDCELLRHWAINLTREY